MDPSSTVNDAPKQQPAEGMVAAWTRVFDLADEVDRRRAEQKQNETQHTEPDTKKAPDARSADAGGRKKVNRAKTT